MHFRISLIASLGITCWTTFVFGQTVSAEAVPGATTVPRLTVAATALAGMSFGYHCEPSATDYSVCSHQSTLVGLRISPRFRLSNEPAAQPYQPGVDYMTAPQSTAFTWAPAASLAVGRDFELVRFFGLAPEVRISQYGLNGHGPGTGTAPQTVVTLGVSAVGFGAYR